MKGENVHFPDLTKHPLVLFVTTAGESELRFRSICGIDNRQVSGDLKQITCLLCFRSMLARIRNAAIMFHSNNPALTQNDLFKELSDRKSRRHLKD